MIPLYRATLKALMSAELHVGVSLFDLWVS